MSALLPEGWLAWATLLDELRLVRGPAGALALAAVALGLLALAVRLDPLRARLLPAGMLPRVLDALTLALRTGAAVALTVAVIGLLPPALLPVLLWIVIGLALAVGWSARRWLPDIIAGLGLLANARLRSGEQVRWGDRVGQVLWVGLKSTHVRLPDGAEHVVPNAALVAGGYTHDPAPFPSVDAPLWFDDLHPQTVRAARDAALLSPWRAARASVHVAPPLTAPGPGAVRTRVLAWEHAEDHVHSVRRLFAGLTGKASPPSRVVPDP